MRVEHQRGGPPVGIDEYVKHIVGAKSVTRELIDGVNPQVERDYAVFVRAQDIVRSIEEYGPALAPEVPARLFGLMKLSVDEARRELEDDTALAFEFGKWRAQVTVHEAENAARLGLLAATLVSLTEVLPRAVRPELIEQAIDAVRKWVARAWCTDVPLQGDVRAWSRRMTWRPDLLPREWREI